MGEAGSGSELPAVSNTSVLLFARKDSTRGKHQPQFVGIQRGADRQKPDGCPHCSEPITLAQLKQIMDIADPLDANHAKMSLPTASESKAQELLTKLNEYIALYGLDQCLMKTHLLAQIAAETGFHAIEEGFNYTQSGLKSTFNTYFTANPDEVETYGRADGTNKSNGKSADIQQELANKVYAGKDGNDADYTKGDGYKYRGRGLIQLTNKNNYVSFNTFYAGNYRRKMRTAPDVDFEAEPDKLLETTYAALSAVYYWVQNGISAVAKDATLKAVANVTGKINRKKKHLKRRQAFFDQACKVLKLEQCKEVSQIKTDNSWTDPVKHPQRTYLNSYNIVKPQNGAFGMVRINKETGRPKAHQGLDLFALPNTPIYACLDGEVVRYANEGNAGYGWVLALRVRGTDLEKAKRAYTLEYANEGEVETDPTFLAGQEWYYLRYAHLTSAIVKSGTVKSGALLGYTGVTGNADGIPSPHLHFEIAMKEAGNGEGLPNRTNPAFYVRLEAMEQEKQKEAGKTKYDANDYISA